MSYKPVVLIVLDGWGIAADSNGNAISLAKKPFWNNISAVYPHTSLQAAGEAVGLPGGEAGNSEVGHLNIGAGMIVYQEYPRINMSISDGTFLNNSAFLAAVENVRKNQSSLHLMGLLGEGNVHSSVEHLYALLWFAKTQGIEKVYVHAFTDGRDSSPTSGINLIGQIQSRFKEGGVGTFASISGRYWAMDRDNRWDRIKKVYDVVASAEGPKVTDPIKLLSDSYTKSVTDEFIEPTVILDSEGKSHPIEDKDSVIFFNFRPDRSVQLTHAFVGKDFTGFVRNKIFNELTFVSMTEYEKSLPTLIAFPPPRIDYPLAAVVSMSELRQLHIGETEKYAHVTYFLNGGKEDAYPNEQRVHIPSQKVDTYDLKPEMSAVEITDVVCENLRKGIFEFIMVNFANADMVAHTGNIEATIKAIETLDTCLERIVKATLPHGAVVITADHGNAENMINLTEGKVDTEHSNNPVPLIVIAQGFTDRTEKKLPSGILADVAPTVLNLMGIHKPSTMTGRSLIHLD